MSGCRRVQSADAYLLRFSNCGLSLKKEGFRGIPKGSLKIAVKESEWEPLVAAVIQVERSVGAYQPATGSWKPSLETSLYLSNQPVDAEIAADAIRKHWGIENKSHYTRDVTLREDASRIRKNPGIFARLRSITYNILRHNQSDTIPQDRFAAALGGLKSMFAMKFSRER